MECFEEVYHKKTDRITPDLDALIEQIRTFLADAPKGKPHEGYRYGELLSQAAAALVQLRDAKFSLSEANDMLLSRAERAEAHIAELHDNGTRLREAADSWKEEAQRNQRLVAELEAERDCRC